MHRYLKLLLLLIVPAFVLSPGAGAGTPEKRVALVIGNAAYKVKPPATAVNDAALVAQTVQAAGFDVIGARDLDEKLFRQVFHDFTEKVRNAGPNAVALVYFAGYGVQIEGENYLVPVDAEIAESSTVAPHALPLSEMIAALAALRSKIFIILDAARTPSLSGQPGGLAWIEPAPDMLIAFNTAPGTLARDTGEGYGAYARALAEMIREGELTPAGVFDRVRLRVHELTKGAEIPWDASRITGPFKFFERATSAKVQRVEKLGRGAGA